MKNLVYRINFLVAVLVTVSLVFACGKLKDIAKEETKKEETKKEETKKEDTKKDVESDKSEGQAKLYFCEQYKNGEEVGVSKRFTPGWLTVMVDTRPAGTTLGVGKVELRLTKIKDASGSSISEKIIKTIPFDVQADWDYTYFTDKDNLKFSSPGTYRVTCQKKDGTPIVSGEVEIVSN